MSSSKVKYLRKYGSKKAAKKTRSQSSHLQVVDDDVDWRSTVADVSKDLDSDDNSDEAPLIAEVKDESKIKWQPLGGVEQTELKNLKDQRDRNICEDLSPPRKPTSQSNNQQYNEVGEQKNSKKAGKKCSSAHSESEGYIEENRVKKNEFYEWGRGVVQTNAASNKEQDEAHEMLKPLARYVDDEDLEKMLKERKRDGDPMLAFMKKSKKKEKKEIYKGRPRFEGNYSPNRFGILPGYRWDGVDRSNGFEKAWFSKSADSKAIAEESYKWSVEDM